jgi:epoxyqueuosine reductase
MPKKTDKTITVPICQAGNRLVREKGKNYELIRKFCFSQGVDLFGVADISNIKGEFQLPGKVLEKLDNAVCLGVRLSASILGEIQDSPTRLYFHHYRTVNAFLDQAALKITNFIQKNGFTALPIPASQILDWQKQKAHLSHKRLGFLAGLGWIGRNNLLVNNKLGSQFRLVSILTNMPLSTDKPLEADCKECRMCIEACPAQAIKEDAWAFDHIRCYELLKEFQKRRLVDQYICGICVNACSSR